jgi:hypothetical protein
MWLKIWGDVWFGGVPVSCFMALDQNASTDLLKSQDRGLVLIWTGPVDWSLFGRPWTGPYLEDCGLVLIWKT